MLQRPLTMSKSEFDAAKKAALLMRILEPGTKNYLEAAKSLRANGYDIGYDKRYKRTRDPVFVNLIKLFEAKAILDKSVIISAALKYLSDQEINGETQKSIKDAKNLRLALLKYVDLADD